MPIFIGKAPLLDCAALRDELIRTTDWERYDNPFEQKWISKPANPLFQYLTWAKSIFGIKDLYADPYWEAAFRYDIGDYLSTHLDAGVHPLTGDRKAVTVLLYLSTDDLEGGDLLYKDQCKIPCSMGTLVMFQNTDDAWHGNMKVVHGTRYVLTASFISKSHEGYNNFNRHAYFEAPDILRELRDKRASDSASEVYVVGS